LILSISAKLFQLEEAKTALNAFLDFHRKGLPDERRKDINELSVS